MCERVGGREIVCRVDGFELYFFSSILLEKRQLTLLIFEKKAVDMTII